MPTKREISRLSAVILIFLVAYTPCVHSQENFGRYVGDIEVRWLPDGRNMETLKEFEYIDPDNQSWHVPAGTRTDGASVPRAFFVLYAPFSGLYRNAALIHDRYCQTRSRTWQETHETFYFALRAAGVAQQDSQIMWAAVYLFGPRWDPKGNRSPSPKPDDTPVQEQIEEIKAIETWVRRNNPSKDTLERALYEGSYKR